MDSPGLRFWRSGCIYKAPMGPSRPWVVRWNGAAQKGVKVFCFPYAGAGPSAFQAWRSEIESYGIELCLIQLPGREARFHEPPARSMAEAALGAARAIAPVLNGPYLMYGHSLGAKIAFETARELRRMGQPEPAHLFVTACQAPQLPWNHPPMRQLGHTAFIDEVQRRYNGIPRQLLEDRDALALLMNALRADVEMIETYRYAPEEPLACPIAVFGGLDDATVTVAALDEWRRQTRGGFRLTMLPGGHFFLNTARPRLIEAMGQAARSSGDHAVVAGL
jgi:medium-chain acyl-[acyl-carrier-protein] hydrolase